MTITEILEAHWADLDYDGCFESCSCGWTTEIGDRDRHLIHQAEVLEQHMQERETAAKAEHRKEWADYISSWHASVGVPICHVEAVVQALRSDRVPFGKGAPDGRE